MAPTVIMKTIPSSSSGGSKLVRLSTGNSMAKVKIDDFIQTDSLNVFHHPGSQPHEAGSG